MDINQQNHTYHVAQSSMELLPNYYHWIYRKFRQYIHGDVLELGCGAGHGIHHYIELATTVVAVDFNQNLLDIVEKKFPNKVLTIFTDLNKEWDKLSDYKFDAIILMDVIEHFKDDKIFLKKVKQLLKPNGILIGKVPAQKNLYCKIDEASGHYRRYDESDVVMLLESIDFKMLNVSRINPLAAVAYRIKMSHQKNFSSTFSETELKIINWIIPILALFDYLPYLPGLSIIFVAKNK
ncbi:bifunctional 2-polyprenyl-6-hydroxyphenol methylase/3-demethylubiquinol 3-O-methyltransferase UbiG [Chromatium okenii]|jgi:SAM-dependent methyltransferase|uniref:class I SAM-dependent methyltransferase n=1 Tax=Chromatium okenii TaxID=61644 RepID=UPI0026F0185F|nr:class I SAM-dependent methyltransferase [Chromatium okenii]MBV5308285.1 class I SAM-dependent methyltransferase [Chromatium okenii]